MNRSPVLWLVVGAGAGAAITALVLRGRDAPRCPTTTTTAAAAPIPSPSPTPIPSAPPIPSPTPIPTPGGSPSPLPPIPPLEADPNTMSPDELMRWREYHHSVSTDDNWWAGLPTDAAWDAPQAERVRARLAAELGHAVADDAVTCKTRCCRVALSEDEADRLGDDAMSSVVLGFGAGRGGARSGAADGRVLLTPCWARDDRRAYPDRAVERAALLARAASALAACGRGVSPAFTLRLTLELDTDGEIAKVHSNAAELGSAAAACAERALVEAAAFAPAPQGTTVPVAVKVGA